MRNIPPASPPSGAVPRPTVPLLFRSTYQLSCLPSAFLSVKAKTAPPFLIASLRPASSEEREEEMASKAVELGKESRGVGWLVLGIGWGREVRRGGKGVRYRLLETWLWLCLRPLILAYRIRFNMELRRGVSA